MSTRTATISPNDTLCIPKKRRLRHALDSNPDGGHVLYLYYGTKEICFDDPELIPFGQQLVQQDRFVAKAAIGWAPTAPYPWSKVQDLLEVLLAEGVLARTGDEVVDSVTIRATDSAKSEPPDLSPLEHCLKMVIGRRFDEQWPLVTEHCLGRALSAASLEFLIPVFLVATSALDEEGRQLGEANIAPSGLRFPIPTEWRPCRYSGSRYLDDRPMNVSALKIMNGHWSLLLSTTVAMRQDFLRRRGKSSETLNLGDIFLFACIASSVPAYLLLRRENPVLNGDLPSVVASLLRVMFGIRMTSQHMLSRPPRDQNTIVTVEEFLDTTDRDCLYLGRDGVCAGPQGKMEEIVELVLHGRDDIEPQDLAAVVGDVDDFYAYVTRSMSLYAATATFGIQTELLNERLIEALADVTESTPDLGKLRKRTQDEAVRNRPLVGAGTAGPRSRFHIQLLDELGGVSLPSGVSSKAPGLFGVIDEKRSATHREKVAALLGRTLDVRAWPPDVGDAITGVLVDYLFLERQALRTFQCLQRQVNVLCNRTTELSPLSTDDLVMRSKINALTRLSELWFQALGISAHSNAERSRLESKDGTALVLE